MGETDLGLVSPGPGLRGSTVSLLPLLSRCSVPPDPGDDDDKDNDEANDDKADNNNDNNRCQ